MNSMEMVSILLKTSKASLHRFFFFNLALKLHLIPPSYSLDKKRNFLLPTASYGENIKCTENSFKCKDLNVELTSNMCVVCM